MTTKVLVFESDAAFASELRTELGRLGCVTTVVDDGNNGLQAAAADRPDLILLSIELPRMNGFSVCNKLKKDAALKDVPLIIMSSESSDETFEQHRKLRTRAEDYVHKPIAFGELLEHIQPFVALGSTNDGPPSDVIVIDDEIQVGSYEVEDDDDERTLMAPRPAPQAAPPKEIDADVDAFIEGGFGRLTSENAAVVTPQKSEPPPKQVQESPAAPAAMDHTRVNELERELMAARDETRQVQADFESRLEAERQRMEHEIEELRSKAAPAKTGGVSSREFLDLREALNKKDKEILSLKESLSKKDKEIFESRDKSLALERSNADLDDRILAADRELEEAKDKIENLSKDKDQAKKASEDFRTRLQKAQADLEAAQASHAEAAAAHQAALVQANTEKAEALEQAENRHRSDLEETLQRAAEEANEVRAAAIGAREAELKSESDSKLASLHRAHQDELARQRTDHTNQMALALTQHETEQNESKRRAEERLSAREAELTQERDEQVQAITQDRDQRLANLSRERDEAVADLEQALSQAQAKFADLSERKAAVDAANEARIDSLETDLAAARTELTQLAEKRAYAEARIIEVEQQLANETEAKQVLQRQLESAMDRIAGAEAESAAMKGDLAETRDKLTAETGRADRAFAKWESDRGSLDRAKDALAVALAQIEEAEGRSLG